ncbi:DUF4411 family protein [Halomonas sp. MMSF_3323]|uniref:DUF4411 family protein n=1 Tax=Halomonas sp. MMSF_3323 TaxID=3046701 RepID=UPI00273D8E0E|nr:DUF4411 family protein [Halomonas sp. MMSF_3323]
MQEDRKNIYLLDANIIITAHNLYYPVSKVPEFWDWLEFHAKNGSIAIPREIHEEIKGGNDAEHVRWAKDGARKKLLILDEEFNQDLLERVINEGYAPDLNEVELDRIAMDPVLVAYALADPKNRIVVTNEVSKPSRKRQNRHVPDVCSAVGARCCNVYQMLRDLDFRTNWKSNV